jgi:hypothetical protein
VTDENTLRTAATALYLESVAVDDEELFAYLRSLAALFDQLGHLGDPAEDIANARAHAASAARAYLSATERTATV